MRFNIFILSPLKALPFVNPAPFLWGYDILALTALGRKLFTDFKWSALSKGIFHERIGKQGFSLPITCICFSRRTPDG
jgi:hypothetical protein